MTQNGTYKSICEPDAEKSQLDLCPEEKKTRQRISYIVRKYR
jgi:hypothetical protein